MKRLLVLLLVGIVGFTVLQCSRQSSSKITIKVVHWGGFMEQAWREKIIAPFEQTHPNITVELTIVPYGLYMQRLLAAAVSGAAVGDVLMVDDWLAAELIARHYALPLDDRAARDLNLNEFYPSLITEWRAWGNGALCGIPYSAGTTVLFYNKDVFDAAHVAYPDSAWTYADMLRAAKAITRDTNGDGTPDVWGMLVDNGGFSGFDTYVYANGGAELSADGKHAALTQPGTLAAIRGWIALTNTEHVAPQPSGITVQHQQMFTDNRVGMMLVGDHFSKLFAGKTVRWDYTAPPNGSAGRQSRRFDDGFIIPKSCEHPEEAWALLKWIATFPPQTGIASIMEKSTPAYKPLAASSAWRDGVGAVHATLLTDLLDRSSFTIIGPGWNEWRDNVFVPEIDNAFLGRKTVEQAMSDAAGKIDAVLGRGR